MPQDDVVAALRSRHGRQRSQHDQYHARKQQDQRLVAYRPHHVPEASGATFKTLQDTAKPITDRNTLTFRRRYPRLFEVSSFWSISAIYLRLRRFRVGDDRHEIPANFTGAQSRGHHWWRQFVEDLSVFPRRLFFDSRSMIRDPPHPNSREFPR